VIEISDAKNAAKTIKRLISAFDDQVKGLDSKKCRYEALGRFRVRS